MPRAEEKELHDARDDVHRWLWFSERYRILQSSMRETQKFAESDGVKIDKKVGKDLVFAAAQTIIEARQLLSDSFIALFYRRPAVLRHGDALQIDKDMFEFAIGELERQVSLLSELVEDRKVFAGCCHVCLFVFCALVECAGCRMSLGLPKRSTQSKSI